MMYRDVVEARAEPGYSVFVRFRDGLSGQIRLERAEFTGVMTPLAEPEFFDRVFVDCGAVAWPGEIELAPDAMYDAMAGEQPLGSRT